MDFIMTVHSVHFWITPTTSCYLQVSTRGATTTSRAGPRTSSKHSQWFNEPKLFVHISQMFPYCLEEGTLLGNHPSATEAGSLYTAERSGRGTSSMFYVNLLVSEKAANGAAEKQLSPPRNVFPQLQEVHLHFF